MINILHRIKWFIGVVLIQVLVLNQMHIYGYATPFFYIYFILKFNSKTSSNELMAWAFALGITIDMFSNTPGMNAAVATSLAFVRTPLLRLGTLRDMDESFLPGIDTLGMSSFFRYVLLTSSFFCTFLLLIDTFSFFDLGKLVLRVLTSTVATIVCIFCAESIGRKK